MAVESGLTLTRSDTRLVDYVWAGAFRLRVEASDPVGHVPAEVFLYDRKPRNPHTGDRGDVFIGVASPVELADYPVGAPDPATPYPFFRLAYVELDLPAALTADRVWRELRNQVAVLCAALDRLTDLRLVEAVRVGAAGGSASTSSSTSAGG